VKYLISAESKLRECMLDSLHRGGIEIVSPTFMNQRQLKEQIFIPKGSERPKPEPSLADEPRPEERMFDKADIAEHEVKAEEKLKGVLDEIEELDKDHDGKVDEATFKARLSELEAKRAQLEAEIEQHKEQKEEEPSDEER